MCNWIAYMKVERKSGLVAALQMLITCSKPFVTAIFLVYISYFPSNHVYPLVVVFVSWQRLLLPSLNRREISLGRGGVLYGGITKLKGACHQFISCSKWPGSYETNKN